jgi:hypothetical protein
MTWKKIKGFEDFEISEYGDIKSNLDFTICGINNQSRYKSVRLNRNPLVWKRIHKLVYQTFVGKISDDMIIDHIDQNRNNNHYSNLEQITQKENIERYYTNKSNKRIIEDSKLCMKCNKDKSTSDFYLKAKKDIRDWNPDKWRTYCKECSKKNRKKK